MAIEPGLPHIVCQVVKAIAPTPPESVDLDDRLIGDLGFHSLATVELAFALEDLFELEDMAMAQTAGIESVRDILPLLTNALQEGAAKMPSAQSLAEFTEEYGFTWERAGDESST
jgi:acyl carrier protein